MTVAQLSNFDKGRIRYHLGYLSVQSAASIQFGIPRPLQTIFLLETSMNNVIDDGANVQNIQRLLGALDKIDCQMVEGTDFLVANKLGDLELSQDYMQRLEYAYCMQMGRLADVLGVPAYPYSQRAQQLAGMMNSVNIPVRS